MPQDIDIKLIIGLKPEEIINYLKRKGYKVSWNWQDTWKEAHAKAFSVAKAMKLDILSDIRNELQNAIDNGSTFHQFKENLKPTLKEKGWWGRVPAKDVPSDFPLPPDFHPEQEVLLGSPWRLKTIYRTNIDVAYASGHYKAMTDNIDDRPYWRYNAVLDNNTRPSHRALHGKVFRADDPIWDKIFPPNDWGCRCSVIPLDNDDLEEMRLIPLKGSDDLVDKLKPGKGWDYNPGKAALEFDNDFGNFSIYKNQPSFSDFNRPSVKDLSDNYFSDLPELLPPIKKIGLNDFERQIKKIFNLEKNDFSLFDTKEGDKALFTTNRLKHFYEKQDGREQFAPLILKTLQDPFEVYQSIYKSNKDFLEYRKTYIGLFNDKKRRPFFVVLKMGKDSTIFWNAVPQKPSNIDNLRKGTLLYNK